MIGQLGTNQGTPGHAGHTNGAWCAPPISQPCHNQASSKFNASESEPSFHGSNNCDTFGIFEHSSGDPDSVEPRKSRGNGGAFLFAMLNVVLGGSTKRIGVHDGSHPFRHRQEVVERIRCLAHFVSQGESQRRVEQPPRVRRIDVVESHGVGIGISKLLLHRLQLLMARRANPQRLPRQLEAFLQPFSVQQLLIFIQVGEHSVGVVVGAEGDKARAVIRIVLSRLDLLPAIRHQDDRRRRDQGALVAAVVAKYLSAQPTVVAAIQRAEIGSAAHAIRLQIIEFPRVRQCRHVVLSLLRRRRRAWPHALRLLGRFSPLLLRRFRCGHVGNDGWLHLDATD
mmetsp:Transcript_14711/g.41650  ORF Transcript_14711/g.41650 Transcript_14711/m.41650 type:complete len:339 (+) Transcript_14711:677-1693(+)